MISLSRRQYRIFRRIQRKRYPVTVKFLYKNLANILKFLRCALRLRLLIRKTAIRHKRGQRVVLHHLYYRRGIFDHAALKRIKARKRHAREWSKSIVAYMRRNGGIKQYIESYDLEELAKDEKLDPHEVTKLLKEQLALLKSGRRWSFIEASEENVNDKKDSPEKEQVTPPTGIPSSIACKRKTPIKETEDQQQTAAGFATANGLIRGTTAAAQDKRVHFTSSVTIVQHTTEKTDNEFREPAAAAYKGHSNVPSQRATFVLSAQVSSVQPGQSSYCEMVTDAPCTSRAAAAAAAAANDVAFDWDSPCTSRQMLRAAAAMKATLTETQASKPKASNFLDMLMNKANVVHPHKYSDATSPASSESVRKGMGYDIDQFTDSSEEFCGFEETERLPGMLLTPVVPTRAKSRGENSAFVSETLNEYMRENSLGNDDDDQPSAPKVRQANIGGLVTPDCTPPYMEMPHVPESLQKLRTVAERRQYLQKFSKNQKLAIVNNEATIYRELQQKKRCHKSRNGTLNLLQTMNAYMPFTRNGWQAASFINTEFNRYYYQMLEVDGGCEVVKLPGVRGNNDERMKRPYSSRVPKAQLSNHCFENCVDAYIFRKLRPAATVSLKKKLNRSLVPSGLRPCPLSHKPYQKPLDDETAALLLAGGSMAVVRVPSVELTVFPELGKPLHEIAKQYLQYIMPHYDISREWAEFSVSTVQDTQSLKEVERAAALAVRGDGRRKSFTFAIPYLNDRNRILVRRVVDRSEQLDQSFEMAQESESATALMTDLSFRANLDEKDELQVECADIVSELINCVAISCSENSFLKEDPDNFYTTRTQEDPAVGSPAPHLAIKPEFAAKTEVKAANKKQNRFFLELKRLNATIITSAVSPKKEQKPCKNEYCTMGCVCGSLAADSILRQHCGRAKCVLECTCKRPKQQTRIMRLEHEPASITIEDAVALRRQATARLARMEKEFTSTVVVTDKETLLINESQIDKKRRCTKVPKRYEDSASFDDEILRPTPLQRRHSVAVAASEVKAFVAPKPPVAPIRVEPKEPVFTDDVTLNELKHCTVSLVRFKDVQNMVPWCMVHELYKCHCGGTATEGKPYFLEKDPLLVNLSVSNTTAAQGHTVWTPQLRYERLEAAQAAAAAKISKRRSTRCERPPKEKYEDVTYYPEERSDRSTSDLEPDPLSLESKTYARRTRKRRQTERDVIADFVNTDPESCRRILAVPREAYLQKNRKRIPDVLEMKRRSETPASRQLLNENIVKSIFYHKHEMERQRAEAFELKQRQREEALRSKEALDRVMASTVTKVEIPEKASPKAHTSVPTTSQSNTAEDIVEIYDDDDDDDDDNDDDDDSDESLYTANPPKRAHIQNIESVSDRNDDVSILRPLSPPTSPPTTCPEGRNHLPVPVTLSVNDPSAAATLQALQLSETLQVPKISGCFSLQPKNASGGHRRDSSITPVNPLHARKPQAATDLTQVTESFTQSQIGMPDVNLGNDNFKDFYNGVIKNMNSLVSKKMQDIDLALNRESKVVPQPNDEVLCVIKWSKFREAFLEGYIFVWKVEMPSEVFLVATVCNIIPTIMGATGVRNIITVSDDLPYLGQLLRTHYVDVKDELVVIMQGRPKYWRINGCLKQDPAKVCVRPTPETHPMLTKKINVLCSLLVKQRIKDCYRKMLQQQSHSQQQQRQLFEAANLALPDCLQAQEAFQQAHQYLQQQAHEAESQSQSTKLSSSLLQPNKSEKKQEPIPQQSSQQQIKHSQLRAIKTALLQNRLAASSTSTMSQATSTSSMPLEETAADVAKKQSKTNAAAQTPLLDDAAQPLAARVAAKNATAAEQAMPNKHRFTDLQPQQSVDTSLLLTPSNTALFRNLMASVDFTKVRSDLELRKVNKADIDTVQLPENYAEDHRWLVLDMYSDFSHILVPDFRHLVSLDRIQKALFFSRQKQRVVKLQFGHKYQFGAFVTPLSGRKLYFGPLRLNTPPPTLVLLQCVDGSLMLREAYQKQHNVKLNPQERTKAFWVLKVNGQICFDMSNKSLLLDPTDYAVEKRVKLTRIQSLQPDTKNVLTCKIKDEPDDSDDDCVIISDDDDEKPPEMKKVKLNVELSNGSEGVSALNSDLPQMSTNSSESVLLPNSMKHLNFTIEAPKNSKQLHITSNNSVQVQSSSPEKFIPLLITSNSQNSDNSSTDAVNTDSSARNVTFTASKLQLLASAHLLDTLLQPKSSSAATSTTTTSPQTKLDNLPAAKAESTSAANAVPKESLNPARFKTYIANLSQQGVSSKPVATEASTRLTEVIAGANANIAHAPVVSQPTFLRPDVQMSTAVKLKRTSTQLPVPSSPPKVKQRRLSMISLGNTPDGFKIMVTPLGAKGNEAVVNASEKAPIKSPGKKLPTSPTVATASKRVSRIGSTTITHTKKPTISDATAPQSSVAPIVLGVNFADGQDEPMASIVIKQTASTPSLNKPLNGSENNSETMGNKTAKSHIVPLVPKSSLKEMKKSTNGTLKQLTTVRVVKHANMLEGGNKRDTSPSSPVLTMKSAVKVATTPTIPVSTLKSATTQKMSPATSSAHTKEHFGQSYLKTNSGVHKAAAQTAPSGESAQKAAMTSETLLKRPSQMDVKHNYAAKRVQRLSLPSVKPHAVRAQPSTSQPSNEEGSNRLSLASRRVTVDHRPTTSTLKSSAAVASTSAAAKSMMNMPTTSSTKSSAVTVTPTAAKCSPPLMSNGKETMFGHFYAVNQLNFPHFLAKRNEQEYIVKVPPKRIVRLRNLEHVNSFLNHHLIKFKPDLAPRLPVVWRFVAQLCYKKQGDDLSSDAFGSATKLVPVARTSTTSAKLSAKIPLSSTLGEDGEITPTTENSKLDTILIDD